MSDIFTYSTVAPLDGTAIHSSYCLAQKLYIDASLSPMFSTTFICKASPSSKQPLFLPFPLQWLPCCLSSQNLLFFAKMSFKKKKKWLSGHVSHQLKTLQWFLLLLRMKSELFAMASKVLHDLCPRFPLILSLLLWAFSHYALALQPPCSPPIHSHTRAFGFYFLFAETFPQSSIAQFVLISAKMSFP